MPEQLTFGGGLNAQAAPHLLRDGECAAAYNIDFSLEDGAASVRRGSIPYDVVPNASSIKRIFRHYSDEFAIDQSPLYAQARCLNTDGLTYEDRVYRRTGAGWTSVVTPFDTGDLWPMTSYHNHTYIGASLGTYAVKDDGSNTTEWVLQAPADAPNVTIVNPTALAVATTFLVYEGTPFGTQTGTCTATADSTTNRILLLSTPYTTNLDQAVDLATIGDYGIDTLEIEFSNPSLVTKVSRDYSIGDTDFTSYYHTEMDLVISTSADALGDATTLVDSVLNQGTSTIALTYEERQQMISAIRQAYRPIRTRISAASGSFNAWVVGRPKFELITNGSNVSGWGDIRQVRVVIEATDEVVVKVRNWKVRGSERAPLNDMDVGYTWWETWATVDPTTGAVLAESAPSPPSTRMSCQSAYAVCTSTATATGTQHGLTHRIWYRQGGYLNDAYAVGTTSLAVSTFTDTTQDLSALSQNSRLTRNILPQSYFTNGITAMSEFKDHMFYTHGNKLQWSYPGQPAAIGYENVTAVSHEGIQQ